MKYFSKVIYAILIMLFLIGCGSSESIPDYVGEISPYSEIDAAELICMYMEETDVSTDVEQIDFYIENQSNEEFLYGIFWYLEVLYDDVWHTVPIKMPDDFPEDSTFAVAQIGIISRPGTTNKESLSFMMYSYNFKSGIYRVVQLPIDYKAEKDKIMVLVFEMVE